MDRAFLMLNFCTEYSSEGSIKKDLGVEYCFSTIFKQSGLLSNTYTIKLYKLGDRLYNEKSNNVCLTNRGGIVKHLKLLRSVVNFSYRLKETNEYYILKLKISGSVIFHKYALAWVRYLYEFPFNVFLYDANRLKELPEFKGNSVFNLFNMIAATSHIDDHGTYIHSIGGVTDFKYFVTINTLKGRLSSNNYLEYLVTSIPPDIEISYLDSSFNTLHSLDYWMSDIYFNKRVKRYRFNYRKLKELQDK